MMSRALVTATAALTLAGCALLLLAGCLTATTVNVDRTGRDVATVEADTLACWQAAEAANPASGRQLLVGLAFGPAGGAIDEAVTGDSKARLERVKRAAETCMETRGYKVSR